MSAVQEIVPVCASLPEDKQAEVVDFVRFLLARQDDAAWEERLAYPKRRPRLDSFLRESAREGDEPLDLNRLRIREHAQVSRRNGQYEMF